MDEKSGMKKNQINLQQILPVAQKTTHKLNVTLGNCLFYVYNFQY